MDIAHGYDFTRRWSGTTISVTTNGSVSGTLSVRALSPCGSSQLQTLSISEFQDQDIYMESVLFVELLQIQLIRMETSTRHLKMVFIHILLYL